MNAKNIPINHRFVYDIEIGMSYDEYLWNRGFIRGNHGLMHTPRWDDPNPPKERGMVFRWIDSEVAMLSWRYQDFITESLNHDY